MHSNTTGSLRILLLTLFSGLLLTACSDYGYGGDYGDNIDNNDRILDSKLYGTWTHVAVDNTMSYTFKSNGECIQTTYGTDYDWLWEIVDGQLKLYVTNGTPTYKTYKIEGNKLYFWSDYIDDWALPFTKQ